MKSIQIAISLFLVIGFGQYSRAQSTTGGKSGGSTASTGTGYLTEGKRAAETSAQSMTIADEGASRAYMYVPPTPTPLKNRSTSPDGSSDAKSRNQSTDQKKTPGKTPAAKKNSSR